MAKDLIIGGASGYTWDQLKYWVNSIKSTGFKGDIVVCASNINQQTIEKLNEEGVKLAIFGRQEGDRFVDDQGAPHVKRLFYIWSFLAQTQENYRFVVTTDTRDVVFQSDPSSFLDKKLLTSTLICSSEGLLYKDEPWGDNNLKEALGPYFANIYRENMIYNVGTIAGFKEDVRDLMLMIFQLSINRPVPIVDQAMFNFLINQIPYDDNILRANNQTGWAIQLGTTRKAVEAGFGDLGAKGDLVAYDAVYKDVQPVIDKDTVLTPAKEKYCIVHQWDRVPGLKEEVMKRYG